VFTTVFIIQAILAKAREIPWQMDSRELEVEKEALPEVLEAMI